MANNHLPLGLTRYRGGTFDRLHGDGSMCITASSVPDLFGCGRNGKFALAAHVMGLIPIKSKDTPLTKRGRQMQPVIAKWFEEDTEIETKHIHAWRKHDDLAFYASPDVIADPKGEQMPGEIKMVAQAIFDEEWAAGPPEKVLLQHQAQLMVTGAERGPIIAGVMGEFVHDLHHWMIDAHQDAQEAIEQEVWEFLAACESKQLPPPDFDFTSDRATAIKLANGDQGISVTLPDEAERWMDRYNKLGKIAKRVDAERETYKAKLCHAMGEAGIGRVNDKRLKVMKIDMAEQHRCAYEQTRIHIKDESDKT